MAYVTYEPAIKCKRCGKLTTSVKRCLRTVLCQGCGTHIMTYEGNLEVTVTENAEITTAKVIHKLFSDIYEEVIP